jgi:hypothetical protein
MTMAERRQCDADRAGIGGCQAPVTWTVKAAPTLMHACGRHLNRVCLKMRETGAEHMFVSAVRE